MLATYTVFHAIGPAATVAGDPLPDLVPVASGTAPECVAALFRAMDVHELREAQRLLSRRRAVEAGKAAGTAAIRAGLLRIAPDTDSDGMADVVTLHVPPAEESDDCDEDGDEVLDPTPIVSPLWDEGAGWCRESTCVGGHPAGRVRRAPS